MKKLLILLLVVTTACTKEYCGQNDTKIVTLNTINLLKKTESEGISSKNACEFPSSFVHYIPNEFNVFFIPLSGGDTIEYNNIVAGTNNFEIPAEDYRVVVTNYTSTDLPDTTTELYLYGEAEIYYSTTDTGTVNVGNLYSAIMVANTNKFVKGTPTLDGTDLVEVSSDWWFLYSKVEGNETLLIPSRGGEVVEHTTDHTNNKVYKYMICKESSTGIVIDTNILNEEIEVVL